MTGLKLVGEEEVNKPVEMIDIYRESSGGEYISEIYESRSHEDRQMFRSLQGFI